MSSFVIDKKEYIKAAGVLSGIEKATRRNYRRRLWVYDYQHNDVMQGMRFYDVMDECFQMNALSVQEQYHDSEAWTDSEKYMDVFTAYEAKGSSATFNYMELRRIIFELRMFFRSAEYQTEKEAYSFKMKMIFNAIMESLMGFLYDDETKSWSSLDI